MLAGGKQFGVCQIPMQRTIYSVWGLNCKTAACCQAFLPIRKIICGKETHAAEGLVTALLGWERKSERESNHHLKGILRVIEAVDADVVLQRWARQWSEDGQFETFGCCFGDGLSHQGVRAEGLCQDVAGLGVQLDVAWGSEVFFPDYHHILREKEATLKIMTTQSCFTWRPLSSLYDAQSPCCLHVRLIR